MIGETDYIYKKINGAELGVTFLPPENNVYKKAPLYFIIPGGGWHKGTRQSMIVFSKQSVTELRKKGFAVAAVNYRLTSDGVTNVYDILEDCFDALSYVCGKAEELGIDIGNIILSGHSAGAHLALMLGYCDCEKFSKNKKNYKIKGVAAMSAPTVLYDNRTHRLAESIAALFRNCDFDKASKETSPVTYASKDCPPTLLCAGTSDYLVFAVSSEILYNKLVEKNAEAEIILSVCGGHSFEKVHGSIEPGVPMEEIQSKITEFAISHIDNY